MCTETVLIATKVKLSPSSSQPGEENPSGLLSPDGKWVFKTDDRTPKLYMEFPVISGKPVKVGKYTFLLDKF